MVFKFIRYTQPGWQFNLLPQSEGMFPSCLVANAEATTEIADDRYETKSAKLADLGYRLWNKGVLLESSYSEITSLRSLPKPTLRDEYIFIKKYWGSGWTGFAFLVRLLTFKNPFKEFPAYLHTRKINRINVEATPVCDENYNEFIPHLFESQPLVAVIIPTLNRYQYLKDVLLDLEKQTYTNFEVIIIDQSDNFQQKFYDDFKLNLKVIRQEEKLLWTARNRAIKETSADYLLFFDDDSRVNENWVQEHLKCIDFFRSDISAGISLSAEEQTVPLNKRYFRWADKLDSGNVMLKRNVFEKIGLFDEQFNKQRMGDGEFGLRAYINGYRSILNYKAYRVHLKVDKGGLREMTGWDAFRPGKLFAPKPIPSMIYLYKKYFPPSLYRNAILIGMMLSNVPYKYKKKRKFLAMSVLLTVVKAPLLAIQFYRSYRIADRMMKTKTV